MIILASASAVRAMMLKNAGVEVELEPHRIDESIAQSAGLSADQLAIRLAEDKAQEVSGRRSGDIVIGADQTMVFDGQVFGKARTAAEARERLLSMRAASHELHSAAVVTDGRRSMLSVERVVVSLRDYNEQELDSYVAAMGDRICASATSYEIEGLGAQLIERVEGDHFSALGMPLFKVLASLRMFGAL